MVNFSWKEFEERMRKRFEKETKHLVLLYNRLQSTQVKDSKLEIGQELHLKSLPIIYTIIFEELRDLSDDEFQHLDDEINKAIDPVVEKLGEDYITYEFMRRKPLDVLREVFLIAKSQEELLEFLKKRIDLFQDVDFLTRFIWLLSIRLRSIGLFMYQLQRLFDVIQIADNVLNINIDWATIVLALNLEEALIKKKLLELGEKNEDVINKKYHERFCYLSVRFGMVLLFVG